MTHDYSNTVIPDQVWTVEELERFRTSIIEECAQVAASFHAYDRPAEEIAAAIRALKNQQ